MSLPLVVDGTTYQYPERRNQDWGISATAWASAVTSVISTLRSPSLPFATTGQLRLGNTDSISWRNAGDTDNITLYVDPLDRLIYDDGVTQKDLSLTGGGNVQNLLPSTDNAIARFDGPSGAVIQNSLVTVSDTGAIVTPASVEVASVDVNKAHVPIGTVIWHYDFNGALVPDPVYWVPCDGTMQTVGGVLRLMPDLSQRYICGFGTEGSGNIDTAPWSTTPVGNAGNEINLAHTHTMAHTHPVDPPSTTTSTDGAHTHDSGSYFAALDFDGGTNQIFIDEEPGNFTASYKMGNLSDDGASGSARSEGVNVGGTSASNGDHDHTVNIASFTSGAASVSTTSSSLSSPQSIQPRSILMRAYMRAA